MAVVPEVGPITLTAGQTATVVVFGFDQFGNSMPVDFVLPAVTLTSDHPEFATVDAASLLSAIAAGTANIKADLTSAEGLALSDVEVVTVLAAPPPVSVLKSIKIGFVINS